MRKPRLNAGGVPIRDWPEAIRPRKRLIRDGPPALADAQLLALVVGSGTARRSAVALAETVLHSAGGLGALARADRSRLTTLGLRAATAAGVVALLELGRRALAAERAGARSSTRPRPRPARSLRTLRIGIARRWQWPCSPGRSA